MLLTLISCADHASDAAVIDVRSPFRPALALQDSGWVKVLVALGVGRLRHGGECGATTCGRRLAAAAHSPTSTPRISAPFRAGAEHHSNARRPGTPVSEPLLAHPTLHARMMISIPMLAAVQMVNCGDCKIQFWP
jgi:hypothetical protein